MTNGISGLRGRLKAFDNTIKGKRGHGGVDIFRYKHQNYSELIKKLYVSIAPFKSDVTSNLPNDLIVMGNLEKFEYQCFAEYVTNINYGHPYSENKKSNYYGYVNLD